MAKTPADIRSLARSYTNVALHALGTIAERGESESARVAAATALLDRGYGKPTQVHAGDENNGPIVIRWEK